MGTWLAEEIRIMKFITMLTKWTKRVLENSIGEGVFVFLSIITLSAMVLFVSVFLMTAY